MKMLPPSNQQSEGNPLKQSKKAYLWVMAISGVTNILMFALPIYMMQVYERVLPGQKIETLVLLTIIVLFILAIYTLFSHIRTRILMDISQWVDRQISRPLLEKSADAVLEGNEYPNQALADVYSINQFLGSSALASLFDLPWSPLYFAVLFGIHPLLGFFSVCLAVLIFHLAVLNEMLMRKNVISQVKSQKYVQSLMGSMVRSSEVLQAMGMSQNVKNRLLEEKEKTLNFQLSTSKVGERILSLIKYLRLIGQVLILGIGAYLVIQGNITGGAMIAGSIFMSRGLAPIEQAIGAWKLFIQFRDAYKRVESFLAKPSTRQERMELPAPKGDVFLENVHFTFTNAEQFVLKQVTMHVPPGSMVAVIGHSASGKTTLCRLILGILKPSLGRVCLDGAEVYHRNRMEIGPHIGYLPQDIELFPGTIKENIARLGEVDPEAVVKAARLAGAHEMILKLPQG